MSQKTGILIVDDYPSVRADLRTLLELVEGVEVVGETANGSQALHLAELKAPDIILIDLDIDRSRNATFEPGGLIKRLKDLAPEAKILALSASGCGQERQGGLLEGIDAVFVKGAETEQLFKLVLTIRQKDKKERSND